MAEFFVPALSAMMALVAYAGVQHGVAALRQPIARAQALFAALCIAMALQMVARIIASEADSAQFVVESRRWEVSAVMVFLAILPWFIAVYTGTALGPLQAAISTLFMLALAANVVLPQGLGFAEVSAWDGTQPPPHAAVSDVRLRPAGLWHFAIGLGLLVTLSSGILACVRQYRSGSRRQAWTLGACLAVAIGAYLASFGFTDATQVAEFGFVLLVIVMHHQLDRDERQASPHLQAILDQLPAMVQVKAPDGRCLMANSACAERFGTSGAALVGSTDFQRLPQEQAEANRVLDERVLATGLPWHGSETLVLDGKPRHCAVVTFPLLGPHGRTEAVCSITSDVTELRDAHQEVQLLRRRAWHADRVERTAALAASVAHEISQPLTAILCNAQAGLRFLTRDTPDLDELRGILSDIVRDDKRAGGVVNGLRAMLRRQETPREPTDVGQCVHEVIELMHSQFVERGVEVSHCLAPGCVGLLDKGQIQQVLLNLMMNADEAMAGLPRRQRRLALSVERVGTHEVQVAVGDAGPGVPEDAIERVFEGFYSTKPQGLGIGLALCRSIVEAHGGSIRALPNEGRGATFAFTLPIEGREPEPEGQT